MKLPSNLIACVALVTGAEVLAQTTNAPNASPGNTTNAPGQLGTVVVTAELDAAREQIAPSLGAVTYTIGPNQIQTMGQGENSSFQQVLLQAPGVVQEEFGEIHVRGDHGDVQYRVNGVLLPESLNGFGQEIDTHLIQSVTLITGTMPAQFGDRTAGIIDVTTKTGSQLNGAELSLYGGSYDTFNPSFQWGGTTSNLDYFVAASYLHDDLGIDNTTASPNPLHDVTDQEKFFGYFSHRFDQTSRLTLLLSSSDAGFQIPDTAGVAPIYQLANSPPADSATANNYQYRAELLRGALLSEIRGQPFLPSFRLYADIRTSVLLPTRCKAFFWPATRRRWITAIWPTACRRTRLTNWAITTPSAPGCWPLMTSNDSTHRPLVFPSSSQFTASPTTETIPVLGGPAPLPGNPPQSSIHSIHDNRQRWKQRVDRRHLPAGRMAIDRPPDLELRRCVTTSSTFRLTTSGRSVRAPIWSGRSTTPPPPTSAMRAISCRPRCNTFRRPPSKNSNTPPTLLSMTADDPPKVERDNYFDVGLSRQITPAWQITGDSFCKLAKNLLDDGQFGSAVILNNFNYSSGTVYGAELGSTYKQGPFLRLWELFVRPNLGAQH